MMQSAHAPSLSKSRIDVLLPVKNGVDFLAESIDSILAQTVNDWRLLILDHGSTDGSRELAQQYVAKDSRIELHDFPQSQGLSGLLNSGLEICNAEFIMRHDADDICYPERMEITLHAFAEDPECIAIGGQADMIDSAGQITGEMIMPVDSRHVAAACLFYNPMAHPTTMLRHASIKAMGIRYGDDFLLAVPEAERIQVPSLAEDYFLFGQLAVLGKCKNVPVKLIRYRWHANNVSAVRSADQMQISLKVARYLARSFAILHQIEQFDPVPFCNLGGKLVDLPDTSESKLNADFKRMSVLLQRGFGTSAGLKREFAFRRVTATRNTASILWRYMQFRLTCRPVSIEWSTLRIWLIGCLPFRHKTKLAFPVQSSPDID